MSTLEELVQVKRNELELEQLMLFEQSKTLFIAKLNDVLGEKIVTSMNLIIKSKFKCLHDVDIENVQALLKYNDEVYIITLTDKLFKVELSKGSRELNTFLGEAKDEFINYLANIKAFHNTEVN